VDRETSWAYQQARHKMPFLPLQPTNFMLLSFWDLPFTYWTRLR